MAKNAQRRVPGPPPAMPVVPFTSAAHEHTEIAFDETVELTANPRQLPPINVPAFGYFRHALLEVSTVTAGEQEGGAVTAEDFPWNIFQSIQIGDVNGAPIYGPLDGYAALWTSVLGGYAGRPDPRQMPFYNGTFLTPSFLLRVPLEISHYDGFGSLANQNAAASYRVNLTVNGTGSLSTKITKAPKIRIRVWIETWTLPNETDIAGRPQSEAPPMLDSAQYHSSFIKDVPKGAMNAQFVRVGSLIRNVFIIARTAAGVRSDKVFPTPALLEWDARKIREDSANMMTEMLAASTPELKSRDTGVFAYLLDRSTKNTVGDDSPALWLPTAQSTRMEIKGNNEEAGTLQIVTNDVAPVAVQPQERYQEESRTGFQPEFGAAPAGRG